MCVRECVFCTCARLTYIHLSINCFLHGPALAILGTYLPAGSPVLLTPPARPASAGLFASEMMRRGFHILSSVSCFESCIYESTNDELANYKRVALWT